MAKAQDFAYFNVQKNIVNKIDSFVVMIGPRKQGKGNTTAYIASLLNLPAIVYCNSPAIHKSYPYIPQGYRHKDFPKETLNARSNAMYPIIKECELKHKALKTVLDKTLAKQQDSEHQALRIKYQKTIKDASQDRLIKILKTCQKETQSYKDKWTREKHLLEKKLETAWDTIRSPYAILQIFDDCSAKTKIMRCEEMKVRCDMGRWFAEYNVISIQNCMSLIKDQRGAIDYMFLFKDTIPENRKTLFKYYVGAIFPSYKIFDSLFEQMTAKKGSCMVIDMRTEGTLFDKVFRFHPPNMDNIKFEIGTKEYRDAGQVDEDDDEKKVKEIVDLLEGKTSTNTMDEDTDMDEFKVNVSSLQDNSRFIADETDKVMYKLAKMKWKNVD